MRKMKDSGVEWIGDIPENWAVWKMKHLASKPMQYGANATGVEYTESLPRYVRITDITSNRTLSNEGKQSLPTEIAEEYILDDGDLLFARSGATAGKSFYYESKYGDCAFAGYLIRFKADFQKANSKFLYYYTLTQAYEEWSQQIFIQATIQNISAEKYNGLRFAIPDNIEQQNEIVEYLDKKCAEIDSLIEAKEKTNALLKEQRQSIIYEAVTKGLNSDVPMKDSGIEWIGDVPETWDVKKIKYCFDLVAGATPKSSNSEYWDGNIVWITPADYKTEDVFIEKGHKNITDEGMQSCATTLIPENCIIFSKRAPVGLVAINRVPLCTNQGCISCIPHNDISSKFYYYVMSVFEEQFELFASGTTFKEISADSFANFLLPNTTFDEQVEIVNYLDKKCAELDTIIKSNRTIIEKLKEYRKSIIFEAVTGKVEI